MLKTGLTGGIATGKSVVAEMLRARGCHLFHADQIAHQMIAPSGAAYDAVVETFGREILSPDNTIDRSRLGAIVFADRAKLDQLNHLIHPHVLAITDREMATFAQSNPHGIFVAEAALHIEAGYHNHFDKLLVTWCRREQQLERLLGREGFTQQKAEQRLNSQIPADEKRNYADYVIDCSGALEQTEKQVESIYQELRRLAGT